ncbi:MAG: tape measure protein [gamma proteobacterium endosymbiont of Lamellibrachia anaximandri]|nr:tape measure protein [gamma proteobacterium endosymbiont of Lamellibrachia anaximandri]
MKELVLAVKLTGDAGDLNGEIRVSSKEFEQLGKTTDKTGRAADKAGRKMDRYGKETREAGREAQRLNSASMMLASTLATLGLGITAADMHSVVVAGQNLDTLLLGMAGSTTALADEQAYMLRTAKDLHQDIDVLTKGYARMLGLQKSGITTQTEARQILEGLSEAAIELAASNAQIEQVMYGLAQGLSSPILRAEELNQVVDPLPGLLARLDDAARLPAGGFRQMVVDGEVTSEFFKTTLIKALQTYEGAAERAGDNLSRIYADIGTEYKLLVRALSEPVADGIGDAAKALEGTLTSARENIDSIASAAKIGGAAIMGLVAAKTAVAIASSKMVDGLRQQYAAQLQATTVTQASMFATNGYAAAQARATVAERARAASLVAMGTAARGASVALGLLGGPAGLIIMGASALAMWASNAHTAAEETETLAKKNERLLATFRDTARLSIEEQIQATEQQVSALKKQTQALENLKVLPQFKDSEGNLKAFNDQIEKNNEEIRNYEQQVGQLNDRLHKLDGSASGAADSVSGLAKELQDLKKAGQGLFEDLFPEEAAFDRYAANLNLISQLRQKGEIDAVREQEAINRLTEGYLGFGDATEEIAKKGAKAIKQMAKEGSKDFDELKQAIEGWGRSFARTLASGEGDFRSFAQSIIQQMQEIMIAKSTEPLFNMFGDWVSGSIYGGGSSQTAMLADQWNWMDDAAVAFNFGNGGVMTNRGPLPLQKYGDGGVVNRPQVRVAGERYQPEAIVPLPDGRAIPVQMQGGGEALTYSPSFNIDARGAAPGMETKIRQIARQVSDEGLAKYRRQIGRGGSASRSVGRR